MKNRFEPFPLTDLQQAYLIGRSEGIELGNISCHGYAEVDMQDWDRERFQSALQRIIDRHEMLRCVVFPEGRQQILSSGTQYEIKVNDLRKLEPAASAARLASIRARMSHQIHASDQWPLFEFCVSLLDAKISRLHISTDLLIGDGRSFEIMFRELMQLYHHPESSLPPLELSFRDYLRALTSLEQTNVFRESREYWTNRVPTLPPSPELPLEKSPASIIRPVFKRRSVCLEPAVWRDLKEKGARFHSTPVGTLLAAYAEVLAIWSKNPHFTINLTLFNRLPLHPQSNSIIGDFTSVDLLEVDNSVPANFAARIHQQQEKLWQDLDHRYFSGIQVMRELARFQRAGPTAIMPVVFTSLLNLGEQDDGATWSSRLGRCGYAITQTPQVYLDFMVYEEKGSLLINWDAVEELFPAGLLDDMFGAYQRLLQDLATDDSAWQRTLAENTRRLIPVAQMALRQAANNTKAPLTGDLLHTPFLKQVAERPKQIAVCTPKRRLTYLEVYRYACRIEEELLRIQVKPNELVAVMMEKGWEQIVAVLGIHFAGAAYLPIDPELPAERQRYLLEHAKVKVALTQAAVRNRLSAPPTVDLFEVDRLEPAHKVAPRDRRRQKPEDLAYVIYTSGSTGVPKGVMIDHRGALNTVLDINQRFRLAPQDRILAVSRLSFDLSVYDVFGLLAAGGTIVMPAADLAYDANHWAELILKEKITIWNTVPALVQLLVDQAGKPELLGDSLRLVLMSGDWIPLGLPDQIRRVVPKANVISLGGATEASIWSILFPIGKVDPNWKSILYGKAMLNQSFHVLNRDLGPCPTWVPGQLYIGGVGLAKGYLHDDQKTSTSFIVDPVDGERLYRTGDLGRFLPDGNIEFLGREDFQVKVQGQRIELGEIESRLQEYAGVDLCIVIVREDTPREKRLVGYVVPTHGISIDPAAVREHLRTKLPEYMVPSAIVILDRFPLTPNGKVDRKALPAPARIAAEVGPAFAVFRDSLDLQLINLWEKILSVRPIGLQDNFFDLGGNSFVAAHLFSEMRRLFDRSFPLSVLFEAPTVEKLADIIRKDGWSSCWTSLVPIQPGGSKPPFFCVHGGGGNVLIFRELARHLGTDYPFYGLQAHGLDGSTDYLTTTEAMAESYLREMRELQPEGPYYIGGFCMGGQVALEIAQRLVREGQRVNLLFVIDTQNVNGVAFQFSLKDKMEHLGEKIKFHSWNVLQLDLKSQIAYLTEKGKIALRREIERLRIKIVHLLKLNPHRDVMGPREEFIEDINDRAFFAYVPDVYPGKMTICKPRRNYAFLRDPFNGWGEVAAGGLEVIELPSDPGGIFIEPYVRFLAQKLKEQIDQAVSNSAEILCPPEGVLK
ncbi:MAG TPA: amino acid adenylation domain-containing protein [Terriglobia bacterium]|nr:amino acid adenylation domain-containing protein [Terriglobia bacterium]